MPRVDSVCMTLLDFMSNDEACLVGIVRKKLRPGSSTGDYLLKVVDGTEGLGPVQSRQPALQTRLENLAELARMTTCAPVYEISSCDACGTNEVEAGRIFLKCSKCRSTSYCSKECQIQHWPDHKTICKKKRRLIGLGTNCSTKEEQVIESLVTSFLTENTHAIMREMARVILATGLRTSEMVVEVDFYKKNYETSSPAMRNEFKVGPARDHFEGSRPAEPDWFEKGTSCYEENIRDFIPLFKDKYETSSTPTRLFLLCRHVGGNMFTQAVCPSSSGGKPVFSDELFQALGKKDVNAIRAAVSDTSLLEEILEEFGLAEPQNMEDIELVS